MCSYRLGCTASSLSSGSGSASLVYVTPRSASECQTVESEASVTAQEGLFASARFHPQYRAALATAAILHLLCSALPWLPSHLQAPSTSFQIVSLPV